MSVYMTEEEQLEAIKKWWKKYNTLITILFSVVLLLIAGIKYWSWHHDKIMDHASNTYEHLMIAFSNQDEKGSKAYAKTLMKEHKKTVYADAARLILAKLFINDEKYDKAQALLLEVIKYSKRNTFKQVARVRLARLWIAKKDFSLALNQLNSIDDKAYLPIINELKGDIYAATGELKKAIASYKEAITEVRNHGVGNLFLEMKTNELASLTQDSRPKHSMTT